jgi:DHA1 family bicyclomycin/chloramphenicol resistance-like MFS transporter
MTESQPHNHTLPKGFVVILAMLTSISPLAIDMYLPSFITMSGYFHVPINQIEVTLSIYLLGLGIGQLTGGPLSDRYGRKLLIFSGLSVYMLFSFAISQAATIEQLWMYRFLQAVGGGIAVVNTGAIVRDLFSGKEAAKVFTVISMIMMIAPMIAPALGTLILEVSGWQYIFIFLFAYSLLLSTLILKLPETSPKTKSNSFFSNYGLILSDKKTLSIMIANGFAISGLFIFITKASFIYMEYFALNAKYFTFIFAFNVAMVMISSKLNITYLHRYSPYQLLKFGVSVQLTLSSLMFLSSSFLNLYALIGLLMIYLGALGFIFANSIAMVLENFKHISASANALNGVIGFIMSGLIGFCASLLHNGSLAPIFLLMMAASAVALFLLKRRTTAEGQKPFKPGK